MSNQFEQELARLRDGLPRIWYSLYQGCLSAGFKDTEAMILLQTYILGQNVTGNNIPNPRQGPQSDKEDS